MIHAWRETLRIRDSAIVLTVAICDACGSVGSVGRLGVTFIYPHVEGVRFTEAEPECGGRFDVGERKRAAPERVFDESDEVAGSETVACDARGPCAGGRVGGEPDTWSEFLFSA